jgi:hypothetical protein
VDFLLDSQLGVWLLEVNESPDLRFTTPAKAAACGRMLDDLLKLVLRPNPNPLLQHAEFDTARFCPTTAETNSPHDRSTSNAAKNTEGDASYDLPRPLTESSSSDAAAAASKADTAGVVLPARHNGWQLLTPAEGEEAEKKRTKRPASGRVRPSSAAAVRPVRPKSAAPRASGGGGGALVGSRGLRQNCERLLAVVRSQGS